MEKKKGLNKKIEKIIENYCPTLDDVSYVEKENI